MHVHLYLTQGTALDGGKGGVLDAEGGGGVGAHWSKTSRRVEVVLYSRVGSL